LPKNVNSVTLVVVVACKLHIVVVLVARAKPNLNPDPNHNPDPNPNPISNPNLSPNLCPSY